MRALGWPFIFIFRGWAPGCGKRPACTESRLAQNFFFFLSWPESTCGSFVYHQHGLKLTSWLTNSDSSALKLPVLVLYCKKKQTKKNNKKNTLTRKKNQQQQKWEINTNKAWDYESFSDKANKSFPCFTHKCWIFQRCMVIYAFMYLQDRSLIDMFIVAVFLHGPSNRNRVFCRALVLNKYYFN